MNAGGKETDKFFTLRYSMLLQIVALSLPPQAETILMPELALLIEAGRIAVEFVQAEDSDASSALARADAVFCDAFDRELRGQAERLRWVQFTHTDVAGRLYPELWAGETQVSKARGLVAKDAALQVWQSITRFAEGLPSPFARPFDIRDVTVGIVGAGDLGQAVGKLCQQNGVQTVGIRRHPDRETPGLNSVTGHIQYHDLVLASQVIVLTLPLTPHTPQTFGEDEIEILHPGTYLVNAGRMGLIDTRWVERALTKGWLAGAMLTDWPDEPISDDSPFRNLPNCLITPALTYNTPDYWQGFARFARQQTEQFLQTGTVLHLVDRYLGY